MPDTPPPEKPRTPVQDFFSGAGETRAHFSHVNQHFQLKLRAFVEIAMPVAFAELQRRFDVFALRSEGIAPIFFFLDFQAEPVRLAFGRPIRTEHRMSLLRHEGEGRAGGPPRRRLLLDFVTDLLGHAGTATAGGLGFEPTKGPMARVGRARVLQVVTRPMAPPGERDVADLPETLTGLRVQPWRGEFPSMEGMLADPEAYEAVEPPAEEPPVFVCGLPNTDINQHVNVEEYLAGFENAFTRLVFAAGLPVAGHRTSGAKLLFRKPFFAGDRFRVQGRLFLRDAETLFVGGFHAVDGEGKTEPRPNLVGRFSGVLEE